EMFNLGKVKKSGAVMNLEKLDWMNNHYIMQLEIDELIERARPFVSINLDDAMINRALIIQRARINHLDQLQQSLEAYVTEFAYNSELLVWKKSDKQDAKIQLENLKQFVLQLEDALFVNVESVEREVRAYITSNNLDNGSVLWPLRVALSGQEKSSSPFELLWVFGKEKGIEKIETAIGMLG
ncbi:hypothetical protein KKH24_01620, partial [Patescibacteria group bacterium]|nr:hypothetical protein [Patescibacteria group bacterium]